MRYDRLRILMVDDNPHMRQLLSEVLRSIGVRQLFEASSGAEGVQILREQPIDIVMTDLAMEGLDGLDFVRLIRTSGDSPNQMVPVIVVSGRSTVQSVRQARNVGATEFLAKPITPRRVLERVHEVIEHARPFIRTDSYFGPDRRRRADAEFKSLGRRSTDTPQQNAADQEA